MTPDPLTDPDYCALLAAVRAAPDDDFPRLLLADRLEELGHAGAAEFVRAQVELHQLRYHVACDHRQGGCPGCKWKRRRGKLWDRERDLLSRESCGLWLAWWKCPAVRPCFTDPAAFTKYDIRGTAVAALFARGMAAEVRCTLATWLEHGPSVVRTPLACVRAVRLTDREPGTGWRSYGRTRGPSTDQVWSRLSDQFYELSEDLPDGIFDKLVSENCDRTWCRYPSRDAAHAALSAAAIAWAWSTAPAATPSPAVA